ncbi:DUF6274 family protein [Streptomyces sp. NPDC048442]|uniref:DUF6274 family protein n=1 Tax=Streptomyces sp. NPDC048442 TaxID=3154823 RepID=UPI00341719A8
MAAAVARHETRALLRAHLAAASGYRHRTRHCPICHRLLLLALQPERAPERPSGEQDGRECAEPATERSATQDESPPNP